ncbi:MAG: hypothetical protein P4M09_03080 [Devosia sp.]|nr:hypothetical protein [Devosia sp.]
MSDPIEGDSQNKDTPGLTGRNSVGGDGVLGSSENGAGVRGESRSAKGVVTSHGFIGGSDPVLGQTVGIYGESSQQGVLGHSDVGTGVLGHTNSGVGVRGIGPAGSGFIAGVDASSQASVGVYGESSQTGVLGRALASDKGVGVHGLASSNSTAMLAESESGPAISARSTNAFAGMFDGNVEIDGQFYLNDHSGNPVVKMLDSDNGLEIHSSVTLGTDLTVTPTEGLHLYASGLRLHGTDLLIDGRSAAMFPGQNFRALVDLGNKLAINLDGDFGEGVQIDGDLSINGRLNGTTDGTLEVATNQLLLHATDLILDGRSAALDATRPFRAMVDGSDLLVINFNGDFNKGVQINSDLKVDGRVRTAGGDCAEQFEMAADAVDEPGTTMVIGADGRLAPCSLAYDSRVAGIVSGAGDLQPAFLLNERTGHRAAIALFGTVYAHVDARETPIEAGDLLTTSATPGHAMKAVDREKSFGAIIGKALRPLAGGLGLIPVLVAPR